MTQKAVNRLLIITGLALLFSLLTIGALLPARAAPQPQPSDRQAPGEVTLEIIPTQPITVVGGQSLTLTAVVNNGNLIPVMDANLTFTIPPDVTGDQLAHAWPLIAPAETVSHTVYLNIPEQSPRNLQFTAMLQHTVTETATIIRSIEVAVISAESPPPPDTADTPSPSPSPSVFT